MQESDSLPTATAHCYLFRVLCTFAVFARNSIARNARMGLFGRIVRIFQTPLSILVVKYDLQNLFKRHFC
jgi:hypothetical protein